MITEHCWNDTERIKTQELGGKPDPISLLALKSHMDWPGNECGPTW